MGVTLSTGSRARLENEAFVVRIVQALRPHEGWLVFLLAWLAVLMLPTAISEGGIFAGLEPTFWLATLGLVVGWWLAHRPIHAISSTALALLLGIIAVLTWGVHVLVYGPLVVQGPRWLAWALGSRLGLPPPVSYFSDQWGALLSFTQRVGWWVRGLAMGSGVADNLVVVWWGCLLVWCVAAWAGWWIAGRGRPFLGLLPSAVLLAQQIYLSEQSYWALLAFLGSAAMLMVLARLGWLMRGWEASGTDYSAEIHLDSVLVGILIAAITIGLSPLIPAVTSGEFSRAFWKLFEEPYRQMEQHIDPSFQTQRLGRSLVPASGVAPGGLPRAHLLGGRPELGREVALRIQTRGIQTGESFYWRGQTFATYNGRGWEEDSPAHTLKLGAGEPWAGDLPGASRRSVLSTVEVASASRAVLYSAGEPISVDRPYEAQERAPGELIALSTTDRPRRYNVLGSVIDQDPNLLRAAGTEYPATPEFAQAYLHLPDNLPQELVSYAAKVTEGAETPFDKALAIETALREIPYSLDVPTPPPDRELVSWFLFDLKRGYCDYFASAMVVLARLNDIPARLAVGYATGSFDPHAQRYTVTELSAHSWPELYFPGYGWVPFEPTPAEVTPVRIALAEPFMPPSRDQRPSGLESGLAQLRQLAELEHSLSQRTIAARAGLGLLCGWLALCLGLMLAAPGGAREAGEMIDLYARLTRWGARLGRSPRATETPREFARALGVAAEAAAERAIARPERAEAAAKAVKHDVAIVAESYEVYRYAPASRQMMVEYNLNRDWDSLWSNLRRLWIARRGKV